MTTNYSVGYPRLSQLSMIIRINLELPTKNKIIFFFIFICPGRESRLLDRESVTVTLLRHRVWLVPELCKFQIIERN